MSRNVIELIEVKSYASKANLLKALERLGLDKYGADDEVPCRYIVARTDNGRWTAVFCFTDYFNVNKTGGYVGFAAQHGFMSI
jgi:hypothetical protein